MSNKRRKGKGGVVVIEPRHESTQQVPTGLGSQAAAAPGRVAKGPVQELCHTQPAAKWAPPATRTVVLASPAAAVELELARSAALEKLRKRLGGLCSERGLKGAPLLAFERWRFACAWAEERAALAADGAGAAASKRSTRDPVLPFASGAAVTEPGLAADLVRAGMAAEAAQAVAAQLAQECSAAAQKVQRLAHQLVSGKPAAGDVVLEFHRHSIDLTSGGAFVKVTHEAYGKLARLHREHAPPSEATAAAEAPASQEAGGSSGEAAGAVAVQVPETHWEALAADAESAAGGSSRVALHRRLFALLLRYKAIQGHGFQAPPNPFHQAAAGPPVFDLLQQRLGVGFECFASPLNAHFSRFSSAFPDVDGPFGSAGSFFRLWLKHGSYEANPPFVPNIMEAMAQHITAQLESAEQSQGALSFAVILPGWEETHAWQMLKASPFLRRLVVVAAADHGYCDGASHQRADPYRQSPYDSAVFFLQTAKAAAKWAATERLEQELRIAMAQCCPTPAAAQRQRNKRGATDMEHWGLTAAGTVAAGDLEDMIVSDDEAGGEEDTGPSTAGTPAGGNGGGEAAPTGRVSGVAGRGRGSKSGGVNRGRGSSRGRGGGGRGTAGADIDAGRGNSGGRGMAGGGRGSGRGRGSGSGRGRGDGYKGKPEGSTGLGVMHGGMAAKRGRGGGRGAKKVSAAAPGQKRKQPN